MPTRKEKGSSFQSTSHSWLDGQLLSFAAVTVPQDLSWGPFLVPFNPPKHLDISLELLPDALLSSNPPIYYRSKINLRQS